MARIVLAFSLCMVVVVAGASAILWAIASSTGVVTDLEGFVESVGFEDVAFDGPVLLRSLIVGGAIASLGAAVMAGISAVLFNLLTDLTGGVEATFDAPAPAVRERYRAWRATRGRPERRVRRGTRNRASG